MCACVHVCMCARACVWVSEDMQVEAQCVKVVVANGVMVCVLSSGRFFPLSSTFVFGFVVYGAAHWYPSSSEVQVAHSPGTALLAQHGL